tara:strand:- start:403 stop:792 length:390 start_codon:yes stop_codon:yes gene_type:complete
MKTGVKYTDGLTWSNNVNPTDKIRFHIRHKRYELNGSIPLDVRELKEHDIEWLESAIREEIQQEIIEDCHDMCLSEERRMNKEHSLMRGLLEKGKIRYYEMDTDKEIISKGLRRGDYGYYYSDFTTRNK